MAEVVAKDVRGWFREDRSRMKGLSKAARHTLAPKQRGRLHPEARERFNEQSGKSYTEGNVTVTVVDGVQFTPAEARAIAREAGVEVGERGPLKAEVLDLAVSRLK